MIRIPLTGFYRLDYVVWRAFEGFRRSCRFLDVQGS